MNKKIIGILSILVLGIIFWLMYIPKETVLLIVKHYLRDIELFSQHYYGVSILLFLAIFMSATIFMIPVTVLLTVLAGYLYGSIEGTLYAVIGAATGSILVIFLLRRYGKSFFGLHSILIKEPGRIQNHLENHGFWFIVAAQIMPFTPTPLINVLVSISSIPLFSVAIATALGLVPGTIVYTIAGSRLGKINSLDELMSTSLALGMLFLAGAIIGASFISKRYRKA